jgi:hypothetical protein
MPDLDWVTARSKCSGPEVFKRIRAGVFRDLATRNLFPSEPDMIFKMAEDPNPSEDNFKILRQGHHLEDQLEFRVEGQRIYVKDGSGERIIDAVSLLNHEGECRLKVDEQELEYWQFCRRALEEFFRF